MMSLRTALLFYLTVWALADREDGGDDENDDEGDDGEHKEGTCLDQRNTIRFTIEVANPGPGVPDCPGDCDQYKVCMKLATKSVAYTCAKSPDVCPPQDFNKYLTTYSSSKKSGVCEGSGTPADKNVIQCQYGAAGSKVYFLLNSGDGCQQKNVPDYAAINNLPISGSGDKASAVCQSRDKWNRDDVVINSCKKTTSNSLKAECVWEVTLPDGGCDPVVPNDIECDQCAPLNRECRNYIASVPSNSLSYDIPNCADKDQLVKDLSAYNCALSKIPGCNVLTCDTFVPPEAVKDYSPMKCNILR